MQGVDENIEKEEEERTALVAKDDETPPIPPLPQGHLQRSRTPDKSSSVAKIISQFQEAANINNVNI